MCNEMLLLYIYTQPVLVHTLDSAKYCRRILLPIADIFRRKVLTNQNTAFHAPCDGWEIFIGPPEKNLNRPHPTHYRSS